MKPTMPKFDWALEHFRAGERVCVAVSGGADSVALLRAMTESRAATGIVLSAIHVHHGLRGAEADGDAAFVAELATRLEVPLLVERGDVNAVAAERGQGIEEAARSLRYSVFNHLLAFGEANSVATAHTLDDQAETVLMKLLRGAWTEGLGGISPIIKVGADARIVRPLLAVTHAEVVDYLQALGQPWREDSSNRDPAFTRNRVRASLLPALREFAPHIAQQLSRMATVARDEEAWWERELARILPGLLLPGKAVRGGGRANSTQPGEATLAIELERLRVLHPAMQRRVLRASAAQLDGALGFDQTEVLLALATGTERANPKPARVELGGGLVAERTIRELRFSRVKESRQAEPFQERTVPVPGAIEAPEHQRRITALGKLPAGQQQLLLRAPRSGDRARLLHSRSQKTVKEILERRGVAAAARGVWPVLAVGSSIVWMLDVDVESIPGLQIFVETVQPTEGDPVPEISTASTSVTVSHRR